MNVIKDTAPAAMVKEERDDEVDIDLNVVGTEGFEAMFAKLERSSRAMGISTISVMATSMEELFLSVEAWYNPYLRGGKAIAMTLVHTALLRNIAEGSEEVAPGFGPTAQISVPETTVEGTITSFQRSVEELSSTSAMMFEARALFLPLAAGLVVGAFALFPTAERSCRAKDLQLMTGMSGRVFWMANFLFDLHMYLVLWALLGLLYSAYYTVATVTS
ncbi:hypothetical protein V5799_019407, partial [Amblyomma americanum]